MKCTVYLWDISNSPILCSPLKLSVLVKLGRLRKHQLSAAMLTDPQALLPANTGHALLNELCRQLDDPFIGATIGRIWAETPETPFASAKAAGVNLGHMLSLMIATFSA